MNQTQKDEEKKAREEKKKKERDDEITEKAVAFFASGPKVNWDPDGRARKQALLMGSAEQVLTLMRLFVAAPREMKALETYALTHKKIINEIPLEHLQAIRDQIQNIVTVENVHKETDIGE